MLPHSQSMLAAIKHCLSFSLSETLASFLLQIFNLGTSNLILSFKDAHFFLPVITEILIMGEFFVRVFNSNNLLNGLVFGQKAGRTEPPIYSFLTSFFF